MHVPDTRQEELEKTVKKVFRLVPIAMILMAAVVGVYVIVFFEPLSSDQAIWGQFGDYVGGVLNPLLSFLALIALLSTVALQARELQQTSSALQEQNITLLKQTFENTFFQLLRLHNQIVNAMDLQGGNQPILGRDCFNTWSRDLQSRLEREGALDDLERMKPIYLAFYRKRQHDLGHYFRMLYNIVKFVKYSDVGDKKFYTNLVRAQLSSAELTLLFFNCLTELGDEKFKPLVEEFSLLKTLPEGDFPSATLRKLYDKRAYEGSPLPPAI